MYFQAVILAALCAGALADSTVSVFLTAFGSSDTGCNQAAAGNNVTLAATEPTQPGSHHLSDCIVYAPDHGQNIKIDYFAPNIIYFLKFFSEPDCKAVAGSVSGWWETDNCYPMSDANYDDQWASHYRVNGDDWQSVRLRFEYGGH